MPANPAPADRLDLATGLTFRTCRSCGTELELTPENFYRRNGRPYETRCQSCRRNRDAETRAERRQAGGRKFGVEIEFIGDKDRALVELLRRGINAYDAGYTHAVTPGTWKIVRDGSLDQGTGWELVSPPLKGSAGLRELKLACEALDAAGARVNRQCGLHVHHDVSDLSARQIGRLFRLWSNMQRATDGLVAASRRSAACGWARPLRRDEVELIETLPASLERYAVREHLRYMIQNRYRSLNVASYPRQGTVEVRQHQGSLNFKKIAAWVAFGQAFVAWAKSNADLALTEDAETLVDLLAEHGKLAASTARYLKERAAHFAGARA